MILYATLIWFHCGLTFDFTPAIVEKVVFIDAFGKQTNKQKKKPLLSWTNSALQNCQMTLQLTTFSWSLQQFHSRGYGAVKMWPVCSELLCVLLCIHYAFIERTNWPYWLSVFICINSLLYSFPCLSIYPSHSTGSRLLFFIGYVLNPLAL